MSKSDRAAGKGIWVTLPKGEDLETVFLEIESGPPFSSLEALIGREALESAEAAANGDELVPVKRQGLSLLPCTETGRPLV